MKLSQLSANDLFAMTTDEKWIAVCEDVRDDGEAGDVALLLGTQPEEAIERAMAAAALYRAGRVKHIVASGGVKWAWAGEEISEADFMKRVMIEEGVPEEAILLDNMARTTVENMICGALVMSRELKLANVEHVIVVTSQYHMQRSMALAAALLPRKFILSRYPALACGGREAWLSIAANHKKLDASIALLKLLVDNGVVADVEFNYTPHACVAE